MHSTPPKRVKRPQVRLEKSGGRLKTHYVFAVSLSLALIFSAVLMYVSWEHNPQGEYYDENGVKWADLLLIGCIPFVMLGGPISVAYFVVRALFISWRRSHPTKLQQWAKQMQYFRFVGEIGGRAEDSDELKVAFKYQSIDDIKQFCAFLDIRLIEHTRKPPSPEVGVGYPMDEYVRLFPSLISGTEWIEQLGRCQIAGQSVFVWCNDGAIVISIGMGNGVSDADVASAVLVEHALDTVALTRIEPPVDHPRCICPKYYPTYFD